MNKLLSSIKPSYYVVFVCFAYMQSVSSASPDWRASGNADDQCSSKNDIHRTDVTCRYYREKNPNYDRAAGRQARGKQIESETNYSTAQNTEALHSVKASIVGVWCWKDSGGCAAYYASKSNTHTSETSDTSPYCIKLEDVGGAAFRRHFWSSGFAGEPSTWRPSTIYEVVPLSDGYALFSPRLGTTEYFEFTTGHDTAKLIERESAAVHTYYVISKAPIREYCKDP